MHAVLTIDEDRVVNAVAVGFSESDAQELAAKHIMQTLDPAWPDLVTVFEAGVYAQVVNLWNLSRHSLPHPIEYKIVDLTAAMEALAERPDLGGA